MNAFAFHKTRMWSVWLAVKGTTFPKLVRQMFSQVVIFCIFCSSVSNVVISDPIHMGGEQACSQCLWQVACMPSKWVEKQELQILTPSFKLKNQAKNCLCIILCFLWRRKKCYKSAEGPSMSVHVPKISAPDFYTPLHVPSAKEYKIQGLKSCTMPGTHFPLACWRWTRERILLHLSKWHGSSGLAVLDGNPEKMKLELFSAFWSNKVNSIWTWSTPLAWPPAKPPVLIHEWSCIEVSQLGGRGRRGQLTGAPCLLCFIPPEIFSTLFDELGQSEAPLSERV